MKNKTIIMLSVILMLAVGWWAFFSRDNTEQSTSSLKVATTIFPIADIARNIAGDKIEVINILPSGASPHTFSITPNQARELAETSLVFKVGLGLDDWVLDATKENKIVDLSEQVDLIILDGNPDPHYWLSPQRASVMAKTITRNLMMLDPDNAKYYQDNFAVYVAMLVQLDMETVEALSDFEFRDIVTFHESWSYYASDYDLNIVATFEPAPGKEPGIKDLAKLSDLVENGGIKVVFSEPQLSTEIIQPFVADLDIELAILDPLGSGSYIDLITKNTEIIVAALQKYE